MDEADFVGNLHLGLGSSQKRTQRRLIAAGGGVAFVSVP